MDLPPCPACGDVLHLESSRGPAKCKSCGYVTPIEVDGPALDHLLEAASHKALGPRTMLSPSKEVPEPRLEDHRTPSMLEGTRAPDLPHLSPPTPPKELSRGAPPTPADPKAPPLPGADETPSTELGSSVRGSLDARKRELRPRGEILR